MVELIMSLDLEMNTANDICSRPKIIQIGASIGNLQTLTIEDNFSVYVNPGESIDPRITELTGINNDIVQTAKPLKEAYKEFLRFREKHNENKELLMNCATWGGNDTQELRTQLNIDEDVFVLGRRWIDVKTIFTFECMISGKNPAGGLKKSMERMGLKFIGTPHNATHDAFNTMSFLIELVRRRRTILNCLKVVNKEVIGVK